MPDIKLKDIEKLLDKGFEKQAVMINSAFQDQKDHFDRLINDLSSDLSDVKSDLNGVKGDLTRIESKLDRALYTELIHLEARVKRLETKTGIKTAK
jgi:hypothetical protein